MKKSLKNLSFLFYKNLLVKEEKKLNLEQRSKLKENFICSVSGGQDSQLIFFLFLPLQKYINIQLLYCHHFWQHINFWCFWELWKNFYIFQIPFSIILPDKVLINEEQARIWRQENYFHLANFFDYEIITLGHTASDQLETSLINLIRGTSPNTLANLKNKKILNNNLTDIQFSSISNCYLEKNFKNFLISKTSKTKISRYQPITKRFFLKCDNLKLQNNYFKLDQITRKPLLETNFQLKIGLFSKIKKRNKIYKLEISIYRPTKIVRPLKIYHRQDITKFIRKNKLTIIFDPTNKNIKWTRNKFREVIFPVLRSNLNSNFDLHFYNFLILNDNEQLFLKSIRQKIIKERFLNEKIKKLPSSLQKQIIYELLEIYSARQIHSFQIAKIFEKLVQ
jgi:tRNA(Ile)-lysidine synthase TilS/MesJ